MTNKQTIKDDRVIARAYDKLFHIDEAKKYGEFAYPCEVFIKEDGYLGICSSYDGETLFCTSKSTNEDWFAKEFERILNTKLSCKGAKEGFADLLYRNNLSAVFEVISISDPHIVECTTDNLVLLDFIENDFEFKPVPYTALKHSAKIMGLDYKKKIADINSPEELMELIGRTNTSCTNLEGFVIRDSTGYMEKYQTPWYSYWRNIRGIGSKMLAGKTELEIKNFNIFCSDALLKELIVDYCLNQKIRGVKTFNVIDFRHYVQNFSL